MKTSSKGKVLLAVHQKVEPVKLAEVAGAIGTDSAGETAGLVPYFGPTIAGEQLLVDVLGLDLSRALLAGQSMTCTRRATTFLEWSVPKSATIRESWFNGSARPSSRQVPSE